MKIETFKNFAARCFFVFVGFGFIAVTKFALGEFWIETCIAALFGMFMHDWDKRNETKAD